MLKVLSFLKPYRIAVAVALFLTIMELFVELFQPLIMARIIDHGIMEGDLNTVLLWGGIMVGISLIAFASGIINSFYSAHVSQNFGFDIRKDLFEKVQAFSFANFNRFPTSSLITRMTNDITQLQNVIFMGLRIALRAPLLVIGGTIMALIVNAKLALILLLTIPFLVCFLIWILNRGGTLFRSVQDRLDGVNNVMQENLAGIRLIKAFLRRKHESKRFGVSNQQLMDRTVSALRFMELTMPILLLVMNLAIIAVLWFGSREVTAGGASVGEVVAIVNYITRITGALTVFSFIIMGVSRARASANRVTDVLDTDIDLIDAENVTPNTRFQQGSVEFKQVGFRYPSSESAVLEEISFKADAGETIAILGATGSGKTSLFQLIPRLYDVDHGRILIDGLDISMVKLKDLRQQIGYVPQEALLFTGTVRENIAWGKEQATMEQIVEAATAAQIHETIMKLPKQYDTVVGQKGVNLSGGQKQRLSIARALIRNPRILLLDDSTSALDLKTEAKLLQAIKEYTCTTFIITQKISTSIEADRILIIEEGRLIAEGNHQELLKDSDLYQRIFQSQFGEEELKHAQTSQ
ncbi:ABC transporter ATP-binding protein [Bacillus horti]|uniref:ATP-binding cassette subfamily B protein n=1 Tax=Caldalkalibacillus horti TaxID=77523 RepID=A0ABT9W5F4_9BACI|nr:ABC transporter ATP-binding protein [Bacillus horti]MDQ0168461.1 ATP-binding cassette subfamily B protein [Bacillus horti]